MGIFKNKDYECKIEKIQNTMIGCLVVLIMIVILCLIKREFSWGFVDRKELLNTATNILGSYLGITVTYLIFMFQIKKERKDRFYDTYTKLYTNLLYTVEDYSQQIETLNTLNSVNLAGRIDKVDLNKQKNIAKRSYNLIEKSINISKNIKNDFNLLYSHIKSIENFFQYDEKNFEDIKVNVNKYYRKLEHLNDIYKGVISTESIFDEITDVEYVAMSEEQYKSKCIKIYMKQFEEVSEINKKFNEDILEKIKYIDKDIRER